MKHGEKGFTLKRQAVTRWIKKYCMSIEGQYTIPGVCIVALKGGMNNAVNQFVK